ncbi:hypothetical protein CDL15_Pgr024718 [Punica granatum]|uniref:Uncharacterized protein n=1 Tax=Punica granatum TaxID=22663 RepID=A0A218W520_PUNGR|nr:hypothetical protein CDL15_Pgr024718 [Punica granatum]PKI57553.1 hypothetical protein CRG98_022024 [Punica granatum]
MISTSSLAPQPPAQLSNIVSGKLSLSFLQLFRQRKLPHLQCTAAPCPSSRTLTKTLVSSFNTVALRSFPSLLLSSTPPSELLGAPVVLR